MKAAKELKEGKKSGVAKVNWRHLLSRGLLFSGFCLLLGGVYLSFQFVIDARLQNSDQELQFMQMELELLQQRQALFYVQREEAVGQLFATMHVLDEDLLAAKAELEELRSVDAVQTLAKIDRVYENLASISAKVTDYQAKDVDTADYQEVLEGWIDKLLDRDYDAIIAGIDDYDQQLDDKLEELERQKEAERQAALAAQKAAQPARPAVSVPTAPTGGNAVTTEVGTFSYTMIKAPISGTRVVTLSANKEDCSQNCPAKSLGEFVQEAGGFAGIHGTYFCPPDYAYCQDKINTIFSSVYNSHEGRWIEWAKRGWNDRSGITFNGNNPSFHLSGSNVPSSVTAGLVNYPPLVNNGAIVASDANTDNNQKAKATRAAIGFNSSDLFLVVVRNASVIDTAYVMRSLGASYALNLDGGGSTALYQNGSYLIGPGRNLPNAIVLVR